MRILFLLFALVLTATLLSSTGAIANNSPGSPEVTNSWARATPPGATTSAIYMTIGNHTNAALKLVAVKSSFTNRIEIHNTKMKDGMMQMRQIDSIEIEKMATVELKPHGMHMMLFDLKAPLEEGTAVSVELIFNDGKTLSVDVPVMKQMASHNHSDMKSEKHKD